MADCDCKEPCEDCKHEDSVDLDNISNVLFDSLSNADDKESVEEEEEAETKEKTTKTKEAKKNTKKTKKVECKNKEYKDPVTKEYKLNFNNKVGRRVWGESYGNVL